MSNLSELLPTGGGQNVVALTADGAITAGQAVALQSDGTIAPVAETNVAQAIGTPVAFSSGSVEDFSIVFDEISGKTVIFYKDRANSSKGTAVVATITGTSISYGTPVVFNDAVCSAIAAVYVPTLGGIVVLSSSVQGRTHTIRVSGTSISSTRVADFATSGSASSITYNSRDNVVMISYVDPANSNYGTARTGKVTAGVITWTTPRVFNSAATLRPQCAYSYAQNIFVTVYRDGTLYNSRVARMLRPLDQDLNSTFGNEVSLNISSPGATSITAVPNQRWVVAISNASFRRGTVQLTTNAAVKWKPATEYDFPGGGFAGADRITVLYAENSSQYVITGNDGTVCTLILGTPLGANTFLSSPISLATSIDVGAVAAYDSAQKKIIVAYEEETPSEIGKAVVFQNAYSYSNNADFIGFAAGDIADGASGNVNVYGGINESQTGLTVGSIYYVAPDGSLVEKSSLLDIAYATYTGSAFDISGQDFIPAKVAFNTDGTKMFVLGASTDTVYQYSLTTGFDLGTASYDSVSFSVATEDSDAYGLAFNADGTKMFMSGGNNDSVFQYSLSTGFDLSTASYDSVSFVVSGQLSNPRGLTFNTNGTKMYLCGPSTDSVFQYSLTTGFDLSTASYDSVSFDASEALLNPIDVKFNSDGTSMFLADDDAGGLVQLTLSTAFDVSTASYKSGLNINILDSYDGLQSNPYGLTFNNDYTKLFVVGNNKDTVAEFNLTTPTTSVKAGKAISTTAINLVDVQ